MSTVDSNVNETETVEKPEYITKADFSKALNGAVKDHIGRATKPFIDEISSLKQLLLEKTSGGTTEVATQEVSKEVKSSVPPEFASMQKKLEQMEKQMKEKDELIKMKEKSSREKDAFSTVSSELKNLGVRPDGVDFLVKSLKVDGKIKVDEDGSIGFLHEDEELDLRSGLSKYLDPKLNPAVSIFLAPTVKSLRKSNMGPIGSAGNSAAELKEISSIKDPAERAYAQMQLMKRK